MNNRVLLINPQSPSSFSNIQIEPPLGLVYIGTVLKNNGYDVRILDASLGAPSESPEYGYVFGIDNSQILDVVKNFKPSIIGIGCLFSRKWKLLIEIAKVIKQAFPEIHVVAGGIYPSMEPEKAILSSASIDYCIIGEAEHSMLKLCNILSLTDSDNNGDCQQIREIKEIDGIVLKENDNVFINSKKNYIDCLDELPFPNYDLIIGGFEQYVRERAFSDFKLRKNFISIMTSRSCPNKCSFCNMHFTHGGKYRYRTAENVVNEMRYLQEKYNVSDFIFADDNVSLNKKRFIELCSFIINLGFRVRWASQNGLMVNTLDREIIELMARSGCVYVGLAVESGDEKIRAEVIGKPIRTSKILDVVRTLKKHNVFVLMFLIIGFYEDTDETIEKSRKLILNTRPHSVGINILTLFPGTELYKTYKEMGVLKKEYDVLDLEEELFSINNELYDGYSKKVKEWQKTLFMTSLFTLLFSPMQTFKHFPFYANSLFSKFSKVKSFLNIK